MTEDKNIQDTQDLDSDVDETTEVVEETVEVSEDVAEQAVEETEDEQAEEVEADETLEEFVEEVEEEIEEATEESNETEESEDKEEDLEEKPVDTSKDTDSLMVFNDDVPPSAKWYVVHTYSGHEKKVASLIKEFVFGRAFQDKIFKILVPTQQKIVVSEGKKRQVNERLFPGYIIVNMTMTDEAWYLVRSTKGVTGFVGHGDTPTPLPQKEVDALMKFMSMEAPKFEAKFREGDSVKITDGPFQDFLGKVDEVNEDQGKVRVLVSVFGRETPVELDFIQVTSL